jgi:hypothetical protein
VTGAVLAALRAAALDAPDVRRPLDHVQATRPSRSTTSTSRDSPGGPRRTCGCPGRLRRAHAENPGATVDRLMHHAHVCKTSG